MKVFKYSCFMIVIVIVLVAIYSLAFGTPKNYDNFDKEFNKYEEVIVMIKQNKLESVKDQNGTQLYLPKGYDNLSFNGIVLCDNENDILSVLFVTEWDIMDEPIGGYLYRSNNLPPMGNNVLNYKNHTVKKLDFWFVRPYKYK